MTTADRAVTEGDDVPAKPIRILTNWRELHAAERDVRSPAPCRRRAGALLIVQATPWRASISGVEIMSKAARKSSTSLHDRLRSTIDRGKALDAEIEALLNEAADEYRPQSVPNVTLKLMWESRGGRGWGALEEALRYAGGE